ncbi:MAG: SHOCT domain-containing protein [Anaerolineae bacterium]|nr:SHOCT domain-containing protein [Anaerolineae bacterium]
MSRLIMIVGILLVVVGIGSMAAGVGGIGTNFLSNLTDAIDPTAEELCNPGETLDQVMGPESYSPGTGYGRQVSYFCVNDAGERREVTGSFVQGMLGQVFSSIPSMFIPALGGCVLTVGILFVVIGFILSARRRSANRVTVSTYGFDFPANPTPTAAPRPRQQPQSGDLSAKLRQLDEARQSGLLTEDEYQRKRREILDSMH